MKLLKAHYLIFFNVFLVVLTVEEAAPNLHGRKCIFGPGLQAMKINSWQTL